MNCTYIWTPDNIVPFYNPGAGSECFEMISDPVNVTDAFLRECDILECCEHGPEPDPWDVWPYYMPEPEPEAAQGDIDSNDVQCPGETDVCDCDSDCGEQLCSCDQALGCCSGGAGDGGSEGDWQGPKPDLLPKLNVKAQSLR